METITYKGYPGSFQFNSQEKVFYGKIDNISDLITFEGNNTIEVAYAFREAVDDYIELLKEAGR